MAFGKTLSDIITKYGLRNGWSQKEIDEAKVEYRDDYERFLKEKVLLIGSEATEELEAELQSLEEKPSDERTEEDEQRISELKDEIGNSVASKNDIDEAVSKAISALVDGAPEALDTLKEIADWIHNDDSGEEITLIKEVQNLDKEVQKKSNGLTVVFGELDPVEDGNTVKPIVIDDLKQVLMLSVAGCVLYEGDYTVDYETKTITITKAHSNDHEHKEHDSNTNTYVGLSYSIVYESNMEI